MIVMLDGASSSNTTKLRRWLNLNRPQRAKRDELGKARDPCRPRGHPHPRREGRARESLTSPCAKRTRSRRLGTIYDAAQLPGQVF